MSDETKGVLRKVWQVDPDQAGGRTALDDCGPGKTCRNMRHVSFDGMAEPGTDLRAAWRERLAEEGKLAGDAETIRDLVLGPDAPG
ncbi:hypothetical protein [Nocardioides sp. KR10-350]|uniref:hypothetical protein n=1 Tax=Nocardioides cheoyonin TaxID=3156615 RepID=UPI0032B5A90B